MKKLLTALLIFVLSMTMPLAFVSCSDGGDNTSDDDPNASYSEGLEYAPSESGDSYSVVGIGTCTDTELIIPDAYEELPVTAIGENAFKDCTGLTSITIPDSVLSIGDYAFENCYSITSVSIPNNVTYIGEGAFNSCIRLTSTVIGDNVTSIGDRAFSNCKSLSSVTIGINVASIGEGAFSSCGNLTSIAIPDSIVSIGDEAFYCCHKLVEVINRSDLNITVGSSSYGYAGYYAKEIHKGDSKIATCNDYLFYTFDGVNYLLGYVGNDTALTLPTSYNGENYEIYEYALSSDAYSPDNITSVTIPNCVTKIGDYAFNQRDRLTNVTIGDGVMSIGQGAFSGCYKLLLVVNHSSLNITVGSFDNGYAGHYARKVLTGESEIVNYNDYLFITFDGANYLLGYAGDDKDLILPNNYNGEDYEIYTYAFCTGFKSVFIPDSITRISVGAFDGCSVIYCEAESKPNGWDSNWNNSSCHVAWGYKK